MTNNPTIDGVSRKIIERIADHCKFWIDHPYLEAIYDIEPELRSLLAAPVGERQEPVAYRVKFNDGHLSGWFDGPPASIDTDDVRDGVIADVQLAYTAPPELAELQATIDQLRIDLSNQTELTNQANYHKAQRAETLNDEIARLTAENERLKAGQGEPVLFGWWRVPEGLPLQGMFLHYDPEHYEKDIQNAIDHGFTVTRLYTSQPAPVSKQEAGKGVKREPLVYLRNEQEQGGPNNLVICSYAHPDAFGVYRE